VKIWVEKPLLWADFEAEIDPMSAMMTAWYAAVDGRVHPLELTRLQQLTASTCSRLAATCSHVSKRIVWA
jgi:hypothetical protein